VQLTALHVANRTQAARYALRQGWATLDKPPG
jgi:DNA-binding NarL/FixJ family response regulator